MLTASLEAACFPSTECVEGPWLFSFPCDCDPVRKEASPGKFKIKSKLSCKASETQLECQSPQCITVMLLHAQHLCIPTDSLSDQIIDQSRSDETQVHT